MYLRPGMWIVSCGHEQPAPPPSTHNILGGNIMKSRLLVTSVMVSLMAMGCHVDSASAANLFGGAEKAIGARMGKSAAGVYHPQHLPLSTKTAGAAETAALEKELAKLDQQTLASIERRYGAQIPRDSLQRAKASKTMFLDRDAYQRELRRQYPDMSNEQTKRVMGNYDLVHGIPYVNKNQVLAPRVVAHERIHQLSNPRFRAETGKQLDEGVTEYLAGNIYGDLSIRGMDVPYSRSRPIAELLARRVGERRLAEAYFQGKPQLVRSELDRQLGANTFARVVRAMDQEDYALAQSILLKGLM